MKTAILGQRGSFHYMAGKKILEDQFFPVECSSFREIISTVKSGNAQQGLIAIENSTAGSILPNYSLIRNSGLKITGEYYDRIELSLLVQKGVSRDQIREIYTHPMAYQQCQDYLLHLGDLRFIETSDTALAAESISRSDVNSSAAIAHKANAEIYNLEVMDSGIESFKRNFTRFFLLCEKNSLIGNEDKATVSFSLFHRPGALAELLTSLGAHGVNLTKIQSLPVPGNPGEYRFFADLEFEKGKTEIMFKILLEFTRSLSLMGLYKSCAFQL